jgi:hypothetical protein
MLAWYGGVRRISRHADLPLNWCAKQRLRLSLHAAFCVKVRHAAWPYPLETSVRRAVASVRVHAMCYACAHLLIASLMCPLPIPSQSSRGASFHCVGVL